MFSSRVSRVLVAGIAALIVFGGMSRAAADEPVAGPVQVALVSAAHVHTPQFIQILKKRVAAKDVIVKCVWDHDADRAKRRAAELGVPVEMDLNAIWADPQIKAVIICSETDRHEELVSAAAKAHKHVFAEKPLGMRAKDAYASAKALQDAGVLFETGYFMRGDPRIQFIKQQVAAGNFGKITRVRGSNCHSGALGGWFDTEWRWMADPKIAGVGGYGDLGTHSLDILIWIMGDVSKVTATISSGTARYPGCDEYGEGMLIFEDGTMGTLAAGWDDVANPVTLEVSGTEGHAAIVNDQLFFQSKNVKGADGKKPWTDLPQQWPRPLDLFLDAVLGKKDVPLVTAAEAAYRSAVMEAMYQSAAEQKWVLVPAKPGKTGR